jgi:RNA polymerase sigma-70 factor (ECF subfamily)
MEDHRGPLSLSITMASSKGERVSLEEQVAQWFRQWRDPLYRYLRSAGGSPTVAEEVTQESFLRLYCSLREGKTIENPQFWLYRVARNLMVDQSRRLHNLDSPLPESGESAERRFLNAGPDPEQVAMDRERLLRVHEAMQSLTEMQRNCLYLRGEGFLNREIAQILGIGMSSVADALRRGIRRLMKERHE